MQLVFITSKRQFLYKNINSLPKCLLDELVLGLRIIQSMPTIKHEQIWKGQPLKFYTHKYLDEYTKVYPQCKGVLQNVDKIDDDDFCFVADIDYIVMTGVITLSVIAIRFKELGEVPLAFQYQLNLDFQKDNPQYESFVYTDIGIDFYLGEKDYQKRVCRFCGKTYKDYIVGSKRRFNPTTSSHALSWYLGNQHTWCYDECFECNNQFGTSLENNFNEYFSILRVLYRYKDRNGSNYLDDFSGMNFSIKNRQLSYTLGPDPIYRNPTELYLPNGDVELRLINKHEIVRADIYRCLVKYLIDCIPLRLLPFFSKTIDWVNGKIRGEQLPRIFHNDQLAQVYSKPYLKVFIRKDNNIALPFCIGELRFFENLMIFAVPFCQPKDYCHESLDMALENYVSSHYPNIPLKDESFIEEEKTYPCQHLIVDSQSFQRLRNGGSICLPVLS